MLMLFILHFTNTALAMAANPCESFLIQERLTTAVNYRHALSAPWTWSEGVIPPFETLTRRDYLIALAESERTWQNVIQQIGADPKTSFSSVIEPLEREWVKIRRLGQILFWYNSSLATTQVTDLFKIFQAEMFRLRQNLNWNARYIAKLQQLMESRQKLPIDQQRLIEQYYKEATEFGKPIENSIVDLQTKFMNNVKAARHEFFYLVNDKQELSGLSMATIERLRLLAKNRGFEGFGLTLDPDLMTEVKRHCQNPKIRQVMFEADRLLAADSGPYDNTETILQIAKLRQTLAQGRGYSTYSDSVLKGQMVGSVKDLKAFYFDLIQKTRPLVQQEYQDVLAEFQAATGQQTLAPADYEFYRNQMWQKKLGLPLDELPKYFSLQRSLQVLFEMLRDLYKIDFQERFDLPKIYPSVKVYEVKKIGGQTLAYVYFDPESRPPLKRTGAWMKPLSPGLFEKNGFVPALSSVSMNVSGRFELKHVISLFHEFGHLIHEILSTARYPSQFGTNVTRDAIEIASQFAERLAFTPEILKKLAIDPATGQSIPDEMVQKIIKLQKFKEVGIVWDRIAYGLLDLAWHTGDWPREDETLEQFESRILKDIDLFPGQPKKVMSTTFEKIFRGNYAGGFYSYDFGDQIAEEWYRLLEKHGVLSAENAHLFELLVNKFLAVGNSLPAEQAVANFKKAASQ